MKNPILFIENAGYGETPVPQDAVCKVGDVMNIHDANTGEQQHAQVIAIVPARTPPEYAIADQAVPKQKRPLMISEGYRQTAYIIQLKNERVTVLQNKMQKGLRRAKEAGLT